MSTQYKMPWFAGHGSSAPAHIRISQRHWLVSFQPFLFSPFDSSSPFCPSVLTFFAHTLLAFTPTFKFQFILISISTTSNMHSYETLVLLALALSTAFPALSAPVRYAPRSSTSGTTFSDECYITLLGRINTRPVPTLTTRLSQVVLEIFSSRL